MNVFKCSSPTVSVPCFLPLHLFHPLLPCWLCVLVERVVSSRGGCQQFWNATSQGTKNWRWNLTPDSQCLQPTIIKHNGHSSVQNSELLSHSWSDFYHPKLRQILWVTWMDKRTNDSVLMKAGTEPFLLQSVKKRKLSYYGHMLQKERNCMEKEIMQGTTSGHRRRGRPRTRWQDNIKTWSGLTDDRLLRSIEDRSQWRKIIHEAANPRIEDGWRYKVQCAKSVTMVGRNVNNYFYCHIQPEGLLMLSTTC